MAKWLIAGLIVICCIVIIASFFAPWAKAKVNVTKVSKGLVESTKTRLKDTPFAEKFVKNLDKATNVIGGFGDVEVKTQVSGYDIPTLVNKKSSRIAVSLVQIFAKGAKNLDKKSLLVYLFPLFAVLCAILAIIGLKNKLALVLMAIISGAIAIIGLYNLFTTNLATLEIKITIMNGLWQTLYCYLFIFILSVAWLVMEGHIWKSQ